MSLTKIGSLGYGGQQLNDVLPQILTELQQLTFSGPLAGAAANTAIDVAEGIDVQDTIVKCIGFPTAGGAPVNYTVTPAAVAATGTLTLAGVVAGDVVAVNGENFTAVASPINDPNTSEDLLPYQFFVGANDSATAASLANAINAELSSTGEIGSETNIVTALAAAAVVTITAAVAGTAGNAIALSAAGSNGHVTASGATLSGGSNSSQQVTINSLSATGTLTLAGAAAGDKVTVNGKVYTFQTLVINNSTNIPPYVVPVGATDTVSAANLAKAINGVDTAVVATSAGAVVTVTAASEGTAGNAITLSAAQSNGHVTASGATLAGGSATNSINVSVSTTGYSLLLIWFKKDRNLLQA